MRASEHRGEHERADTLAQNEESVFWRFSEVLKNSELGKSYLSIKAKDGEVNRVTECDTRLQINEA